MKRIIFAIILLLLCTGCSSDSEEDLTGLWKCNDTYIKFNGDGTVYYTLFVSAEKYDVTFMSDEAMSIDDVIYKFNVKKNKLYINDDEVFEKVDSDESFDNYLTISSSVDKYVKEIEYNNMEEEFEKIGYLNYINEYFKIVNVPIKDTNFASDKNKIDLVCQVVNKYNGGLQMNNKNCVIST